MRHAQVTATMPRGDVTTNRVPTMQRSMQAAAVQTIHTWDDQLERQCIRKLRGGPCLQVHKHQPRLARPARAVQETM